MSDEVRELKHTVDSIPMCTCGKCIIKRMRKDFFPKFPYNKNLSSSYVGNFDWKNQIKNAEFYNRSKHSGFEGAYKEHLPTGLMSTMKFDYKPFKVKMEEKPTEEHKILSVPFFGRTTYKTAYPNWECSNIGNGSKSELPDIRVPFRGESNYSENYVKYGQDKYRQREPITYNHATLEFYGKFNPDTTFNTSFKPIDFNQPHYFNREKMTKTKVEGKSTMVPANVPKSNYESLYSQSYIDFKDHRCPLADFLKTQGLKNLEI